MKPEPAIDQIIRLLGNASTIAHKARMSILLRADIAIALNQAFKEQERRGAKRKAK